MSPKADALEGNTWKSYIYFLLPNNPNPWGKACNSENSSWAQRKPKERKGSSHLEQNGGTCPNSIPEDRLPLLASAFLILSPSAHDFPAFIPDLFASLLF